MLNRDYRFEIDDTPSPVVVTPVNNTFSLQYTEDVRFVWRGKLAGKMNFQGADYTYLKAKEAAGVCTVTLNVYMKCAGDFVLFAQATLYPMRGEYDESKCFATFDLEPLDKYTCLFRYGKKKVNLMTSSPAKSVAMVDTASTVETVVCTYGGPPLVPFPTLTFYANCWPVPPALGYILAPADPTTGWTCTYHSQSNDIPGNNVTIETHWAREKNTSIPNPPGAGWVFIGGFWYRNVVTQILRDEVDGITHFYQAEAIVDPIDNGRTLQTMLEKLAIGICPEIDQVVSNFYGINPQAGFPVSNLAYTRAGQFLGNLVFFQKSDVTRPYVSDNANLAETSFFEFMENLRDSHNVYWRLEEIAGQVTLRVEHVTYFDSQMGTDFTAAAFLKWHKGNIKYQRDKARYPAKENFSMSENRTFHFRPVAISWDTGCEDPEAENSYSASLFTTDFPGMVMNEYAGTSGLFMMAAYDGDGGGNLVIDRYTDYANGTQSWFELIPMFWVFDRPQSAGATIPPPYTGADVTLTILSTTRKRKQVALGIRVCCEDIDDFDPGNLQKTEIGWGQVVEAAYDLETKFLTLTTLHEG